MPTVGAHDVLVHELDVNLAAAASVNEIVYVGENSARRIRPKHGVRISEHEFAAAGKSDAADKLQMALSDPAGKSYQAFIDDGVLEFHG